MKWIPAALALLIMACNNSNNDKEPTRTDSNTNLTTQPTTHNTDDWTGCYRAVQGRDTILLQLNASDSIITGTMQYNNYGIDGNIGAIQATVQQNQAVGYFRFFSEGMWSVREVIFEKRGAQLLQADTRKIVYKGDTALFADKQNIAWDEQRPFAPVACNQLQLDAVPQ